jgi:putative FmdB family regulatory protein
MPTYEYECQDCGYTFEEFQRITADPLSECPKCHGNLKRLLGTGAGIIFKGSGFYATDYRSPTYQKTAQSEAAAGKSAAKGETKSESSGGGYVHEESKSLRFRCGGKEERLTEHDPYPNPGYEEVHTRFHDPAWNQDFLMSEGWSC